jgi:hypothetical protein
MARLVGLAIGWFLVGCSGTSVAVGGAPGAGGTERDAACADVCTDSEAAGGSLAAGGSIFGGTGIGGLRGTADAGIGGSQGLGGFVGKGGSTGLGGSQAGGAYVGGWHDAGTPDVEPCTPHMAPNGFVCCDGRTIPDTWVCNGHDECTNGADELGCPVPDAGLDSGVGGAQGAGGSTATGGAQGLGGAGLGGWQGLGGSSSTGGATGLGGATGIGGSNGTGGSTGRTCSCAPLPEWHGFCIADQCVSCESAHYVGWRNCNLDDSDYCETHVGTDELGGTKPCP